MSTPTKVFILYQEHAHRYAPHHLVASRREEALPTRVVSFYPATSDTLGNINKFVKDGYSAWLIPSPPDAQYSDPTFILTACEFSIKAKTARKIA